ncbi:MAG: protein kinase [Candidatus Obscuribacterales bacterium]
MKERDPSSLPRTGLCTVCGKPTGGISSGSMTGWIFQDQRCACSKKPARAVLPETFQILGELGSGGMGTVYEVHDDARQCRVAVKVLSSELASDEAAAGRFRHEVETAASLDHPNLVRVFGSGQGPGGIPYQVMEFLDGPSLSSLIEREGPLEERRALGIFDQIAAALEYAHRRKVIHRDLKPSNVIVMDEAGEDRVKVLDFGIAKVLSTRATTKLTQTGEILGSPFYMSPEQCQGDRMGPASDIYSFGCLMYETLTGGPPFKDESPVKVVLQHLYDPAPKLNGLKDVRGLAEIVAICLEKEPGSRYPSMQALRKDLERASRGQTIKMRRRRSPSPVQGKSFRNLALVIVALLAIGGTSLVFVLRDDFRWLSDFSSLNLTAKNDLKKRKAIARRLVTTADPYNKPFALLLLASEEYAGKDLGSARRDCLAGLGILSDRRDRSQNQIPFWRLMYRIELDSGNLEEAERDLKAILETIRDPARNKPGVKGMRALGRLYLPQAPGSESEARAEFVEACFMRDLDLGDGSFFETVLDQARKGESKETLARLLLRFANLLYIGGNASQTARARALRSEAGQVIASLPADQAGALELELADDYLAQGELNKALSVYEERGASREAGILDKLRLAYALLLSGKDDRAFSIYRQCLAQIDGRADSFEGRRVLRSYASALMSRGAYGEARALLERLHQIYAGAQNPMRRATVGVKIAACLDQEGKKQEAREALNRALGDFDLVRAGPLQQDSYIFEKSRFYQECASVSAGLGESEQEGRLEREAKQLVSSLPRAVQVRLQLLDRDKRIVDSDLEVVSK